MLSEAEFAIASKSVLLGGLPRPLAAEIIGYGGVREVARGETVFLQDETADSVFVVLSGWVKLYRMSLNGAEAVVSVFTEGQSFGEAVAFRGSVYPVNAEAVTEARLLRVDAPAMLNRMRENPEICMAILSATYLHLQGMVQQIEQLKARSGAQRVGEFLLQFCSARYGAAAVTLPYDKALIAGRLGMKPESLSRAFGKLREAGVTIRNAEAEIADVEALEEFVERDRAEFWRRG